MALPGAIFCLLHYLSNCRNCVPTSITECVAFMAVGRTILALYLFSEFLTEFLSVPSVCSVVNRFRAKQGPGEDLPQGARRSTEVPLK